MSKIGTLRDLLVKLLEEHERDGAIPTSARFLFYELVQLGKLSKVKTGARRPDQDLHLALTQLRESGDVPWDWIVDESRSFDNHTGSGTTIAESVIAQLPYYTLDPWRGRAPLLLTESRAVAGALRSVAEQYRCAIASTGGQCAGFLRTKVAGWLTEGDRVLYLGDWDWCGGQIEANSRRVLEQEVGELDWQRLALTEEQVRQYRLPVIIKHDRRYNDGKRHEAVETEALKQKRIVEIVRNELDDLIPEDLERMRGRERRERRRIEAKLSEVTT
jgi:hypothetical protein